MSILSLLADTAHAVFGIKLALAIIVLACVVFIVTVVMMQSGNSDGMEAMMGSSKSSDDAETFYGKNAASRREAKLKLWTYICAGVLAVCCIVFLLLGLIG